MKDVSEKTATEEFWWRLVAIDEEDGITVRDHCVKAATAESAREKYLRGEFAPGPQVGEQSEPFFDGDRAEFIKCLEPLGWEHGSLPVPPSYEAPSFLGRGEHG